MRRVKDVFTDFVAPRREIGYDRKAGKMPLRLVGSVNNQCKLAFVICISLMTLSVFMFSLPYTPVAWATEGGGSHYPGGNEDFQVGVLPPAGNYFFNYLMYYKADKLRDNSGHKVPIDFNLDATVEALRFIHITKKKLFGADIGMHVIVPVVYQHVSLGGASQSRTGLGDIEFSPFILGWHFNKNWHLVTCIDIMTPTGAYDKGDLSNIGRNYWTFNPIVAVSYINDKGFEASMKLLYLINTVNSATGYTSGQEVIVDYLIGLHIGNWAVGINGAYYKQTTDDRIRNEPANYNGNKGQFLSVGPALQYTYKNMCFNAKYQVDTSVKNKPEGEKVWLKFFYAF